VSHFESAYEFGLGIAYKLAEASDDELLVVFDRLRRDRQLSVAVHQMNVLLTDAAHKEIALAALRRLGLEHAG
jgi:hypothetical protein